MITTPFQPATPAQTDEVISWVVGRGGILGGAVERALARKGPVWHPDEPFRWTDETALSRQFDEAAEQFAAATRHGRWQVLWCAGVGVVASDVGELAGETRSLTRLLTAVGSALTGAGRPSGAFFLASSAGGVYAGSTRPPFDERSPTRPLSPYGENKLRQEELVRDWGRQTGTPVLAGRTSNLYGPGQNVSKNQGLITIVCRRILARQPLVLYVALDTIRDYCYEADAGRLVTDGMERLWREAAASAAVSPAVVKVIASQQPATIGTILATAKHVTKRPAKVVLAAPRGGRWQPRDLRLVSRVWPELDARPVTPLGAGMRAVVNELLQRTERGELGRDLIAGRDVIAAG